MDETMAVAPTRFRNEQSFSRFELNGGRHHGHDHRLARPIESGLIEVQHDFSASSHDSV